MIKLEIKQKDDYDKYQEYIILTFYVNDKQIPRKLFTRISNHYYIKHLEGLYSRDVIENKVDFSKIEYYNKVNK